MFPTGTAATSILSFAVSFVSLVTADSAVGLKFKISEAVKRYLILKVGLVQQCSDHQCADEENSDGKGEHRQQLIANIYPC